MVGREGLQASRVVMVGDRQEQSNSILDQRYRGVR